MKIILVRHGQAEDETRPDSARQLTDFGQQQAAQTAEYVTTHYHPDCFIVSPYDRAHSSHECPTYFQQYKIISRPLMMPVRL